MALTEYVWMVALWSVTGICLVDAAKKILFVRDKTYNDTLYIIIRIGLSINCIFAGAIPILIRIK